MKRVRLIGIGARIGIFIGAFLLIPTFASAGEVVVGTVQLLPPGGANCQPLAVVNVTPYIYDGALHSYDVTVADPSYVAISTSVGNTAISMRQMTRRINTLGQARTHVDVQTTPIYGSLPVNMTLISAASGQPVCMSVVSFNVEGSAVMPPAPGSGSTTGGTGTGVGGTATGGTATGTATGSGTGTGTGTATGSGMGTGTAGTTGEEPGSWTSFVNAVCSSTNTSLQLWFVLLTVFLLITAAVAISEPSLMNRSLYLPGILIGIPLLVLLAFWLAVPDCRGAYWVPILALIVALGGALYAYRQRPEIANIIQLPPAKS